MAENIRHTTSRVFAKNQKKRPHPLSIRLNEQERAWLEHRANGLPISTYIKSVLFPDGTPSKPKHPRTRNAHLAEVAKLLAILGQTRIAANLSILANAAESGSLDMNEPVTQTVLKACADIEEIRDVLMRELGKQVPSADPKRRVTKFRKISSDLKTLSQIQSNIGKDRP